MLKSVVYFVFPGYGVEVLARVSIERAWEFVVAGLFSIGISALLILILLTR